MYNKGVNSFIPNSFNRYMVECELFTRCRKVIQYLGFNRYMVECEFGIYCLDLRIRYVLIDTWWNVNTFYSTLRIVV